MSLFVVDTDTLTSSSSEMKNLVSRVNTLCDTVRGYDTSCSEFNFEGAKSIIADNINACSIKIDNTSKLIEAVGQYHTELQNGISSGDSGTTVTGATSNEGGNVYSGSGGGQTEVVATSGTVTETATTTTTVNVVSSEPVVSTTQTVPTTSTPTAMNSSMISSDPLENSISTTNGADFSNVSTGSSMSVPSMNTYSAGNSSYDTYDYNDSMYSNNYSQAASLAGGVGIGTLAGLGSEYSQFRTDSSSDYGMNSYNNQYGNRFDSKETFGDNISYSNSGSMNKKFEITEVETPLKEVGYAYVDKPNLSDDALEFVNSPDFYYDGEGYAKVGDRYVISCDSSVGEVGDVIQFVKEDNTVVECVIGVSTTSSKNTNKVNFIISENALSTIEANAVSTTLLDNNSVINNCCNYNIFDKVSNGSVNSDSSSFGFDTNLFNYRGGEIIDG